MPIKVSQGTDPLGYLGRGERDWRLQRVLAFDGLQPTKIRRYYEAPEGIDFAEATALPFRLDATPNADDRANTQNVTTDARRYVANPFGLKHQFDGLWTGGPCEWGRDQQTQKPQVEQDLTRTWCAGHGYTLDAEGRYVYSTATDSLEYMTAADCLKAHRPALTSRFSPYMALREDIPGSYWREIVWRDFTHESIPFIEALKDDPATVREIVAHHFGGRVAGDVQDLTTNVDPATNTVYVKCSLLLRDLAEPEDIDDLMALPRIEAPCTRETLRIFGWNELADGEGYKFTHVYRWPGLKDSATTRALLEWVDDKTILPLLRAADYAADAPTLLPSADGTGRFYTEQVQVPASGQTPAVTCRVPWWRIALQKLDEDKGEDGALAFTLVVTKPEWHGSEERPHVHSATGNPLGWGVTETRVIPSVPREDAARVMEGVESPDNRLLSRLSQTEGADGHSDVSYDLRRVYRYARRDPTTGEWIEGGPEATQEVDGIATPTVRHDDNPATGAQNWVLTLPAVNPDNVGEAIDWLRAKLVEVGAAPASVNASLGADGAYEIVVTGRGSEPRVIAEWLEGVNWFDHTKTWWIFGYRDKNVKTVADDTDPNNGRLYVLKPALQNGRPYRVQDQQTGTWDWAWMEDIAANRVYIGGWLDASWQSPYDTAGDTDSAGEDKARTHALTTATRELAEDGTFSSRVTEDTPHKRYWTWEDQQAQGRKKRTVKHEVWRAADIVGTVGDNQVDVSIAINKYGLVDATRTEAPAWRNVSVAQGATFTEHAEVTWTEIEKSYRKPAQAGLSDTPADGYYWRLVVYTAFVGRTSGGADDAERLMKATADGSAQWSSGTSTGDPGPGSKTWPERQSDVDSIGSVWGWKCVMSIVPDVWNDTAVAF